MPTRELIHASFGSLASHLSAHHFNAQVGYFDYSPHAPAPLVDHDVSFQEGLDGSGSERYTPRWIAYDVRENFAGLRRQEVYGEEGEEEEGEGGEEAAEAWGRPAERMHTHGKVKRTPFRSLASRERRGQDVDFEAELEREFAESDEDEEDEEDDGEQREQREQHATADAEQSQAASASTRSKRTVRSHSRPRPWSSRLLFEPHPRSLVPVTAAGGLPLSSMSPFPSSSSSQDPSAPPEGTEILETFEQGWARALHWDREHDTLDTSLRSLLEASDAPQGFNLALGSSDGWGGFSAWHSLQMADEYPKLERLSWGMRFGEGLGDLQGRGQGAGAEEETDPRRLRQARIRSMNEALALLQLCESSSLYTPLALPEWPQQPDHDDSSNPADQNPPHWARHLRWDRRARARLYARESDYSALLASHFETATLGMRLRASSSDGAPQNVTASQLVSHLTWRGDTPLAALGGCTPTPLLAPMDAPQAPLDPIEALLAARGYDPRPGQSRSRGSQRQRGYDPQEAARTGAKEIVKAWTCFSPAGRAPAVRPRRGAAGAVAKSPGAASQERPFAMHAVARDEQPAARGITEGSVREWMSGSSEDAGMGLQEPWGRSLYAPLAQPLPPSYPRVFTGLTRDGRDLGGSGGGSAGGRGGGRSAPARPTSLPLLSTLSTTPTSLPHILHASTLLRSALRSHLPLSAWGLGPASAGGGAGAAASEESEGVLGGRDGLKELLERVEELRGAYEVGEGEGGDEGEGPGTDEEWGEEEEEGDDGLDWD